MLLPRHDELFLIVRFIRKQTRAFKYTQTDTRTHTHIYIPEKDYESSMANVFQFFFRFCFYETSILSRTSRLNFHRDKIVNEKTKVRLSSGCESEHDWNKASPSYLLRVHARTIVLADAIRKWQPRDCEQYRALSSCDLKEFANLEAWNSLCIDHYASKD
jgi:hypothetical protein